MTSADVSGDEVIGGTRTTVYRIAPASYFDLALSSAFVRNFSLRFIANTPLDKTPPILANSYDISLARSNTIPARDDSLVMSRLASPSGAKRTQRLQGSPAVTGLSF